MWSVQISPAVVVAKMSGGQHENKAVMEVRAYVKRQCLSASSNGVGVLCL